MGLQQFLANQADFWQQLLNDPTNITAVTDEVRENWRAVASSFTLLDTTSDTMDTTLDHTIDQSHDLALTSFSGLLPPDLDPDLGTVVLTLVNFTASPLTGILVGSLGPLISPWVALINRIGDGDSFSDTLAHMVGGFFNGATLDLDALLPLINGAGLLPAPTELGHLDVAFGGLFSPGDVKADDYHLYDNTGDEAVTVTHVWRRDPISVAVQ